MRSEVRIGGARQFGAALAPRLEQRDAVDRPCYPVIGACDELTGDCRRLAIDAIVDRVVDRAGQHQRRARLVDQHAVGLVDDRETQPPEQQGLPTESITRQTIDPTVHGRAPVTDR